MKNRKLRVNLYSASSNFELVQSSFFPLMNSKTNYSLGVSLRKDEVVLSSKSLVKWTIPHTINSALYFGLSYDMDGF